MDQYDGLTIVVQTSNIRCFPDSAYAEKGIEVVDSLEDCEVVIGVKEVPLDMLLPNKTYLFFSHTLKAQPYNRELMLDMLDKNIRLIDHETLIDKDGRRLVGFGRYAGIVGAYNGLLAYGKRTGGFDLKPAHQTAGIAEMNKELQKCDLEDSRILITGGGKVAYGAEEILNAANVRQVSVEDYLNETFHEPVYARADMQDYYELPGQPVFDRERFMKYSSEYKSTFEQFLKRTDILISSHYWDNVSEVFFTLEDIKKPEFATKVIADITCDINGSIPTTIRPSTVANPIYGVNKNTASEADSFAEDSITVMAVDNLPCEIPMDASIGFSQMMVEHVIPAFMSGDKDGVLARAAMTTTDGHLTERFNYLQDYVDGVEA